MSKIAVVTDSNSGITQAQALELGISVIPMPFMIDGETYFEEITLSRREFYEKLASNADISTSQPSPEAILALWDTLLKENDEIVHIPMSSGLSGSCQTAQMLAQDYEGKVHVVNNQRISVTQRQSALDALKLKPVLQIQGEKLDAFAKARTVNQAKSIMMTAIKNDIEKRFGGVSENNPIYLQIAHTENEEAAGLLKEELAAQFPGYPIYIDHLSLSVSCHIGPGALAIACTKKLI